MSFLFGAMLGAALFATAISCWLWLDRKPVSASAWTVMTAAGWAVLCVPGLGT